MELTKEQLAVEDYKTKLCIFLMSLVDDPDLEITSDKGKIPMTKQDLILVKTGLMLAVSTIEEIAVEDIELTGTPVTPETNLKS